MSLADEIPGLREAVEKEKSVREDAFLPVNESIAGFEVVHVTFQHYAVLRRLKNPLLASGKVSPADLAAFLWFLNPQYSPVNGRVKKRFMRQRCRRFFPPDAPLLPTKRAIRRWRRKARERLYNFTVTLQAAKTFLDETFMDSPMTEAISEHFAEYYSDHTSLCALFAREYGWREPDVLNMPVKRLFQYLNEIKHFHGKAVDNPLSSRAQLQSLRSN
jgi:hypothetical protein